ncbi:MAG: amino acid transporter substrate-binding protein [Microvirga sp.]|nr:amino acid transporter substrate-binding protein [Microvirga sp.]
MLRVLAGATGVLLVLSGVSSSQAQSVDGLVKKIRDTKSLTIGHRETSIPHSYIDNNQKVVGYSIELCLKIAEALRQELGLPDLEIKYVPVNIQNRMALVSNGTVDLECGSTVNTLARQRQVDFTLVPFIAADRVMVKKDSGIKEVEDLNGKVAAVPQASTSEKVLSQLAEAKKLNIKVNQIRDHADALIAVESGRVDAYVTDDIILYGLATKARERGSLIVVGRALSYAPYGIMIQKNNPTLLLVANRTLARLFRSGELQSIYGQWFDQVGFPLTDEMKHAIALQAFPE